jgi:chitodextrinase
MNTRRAVATVAAALAAMLTAAPAMAEAADTTPPTAPGNLHAVSVSDTDIVLAWDASTDDSGSVTYVVFFDDNPTPFQTSGDTRFDVRLNRAIGMTPGSTHTFQVRAEDPSGNHSFSNG